MAVFVVRVLCLLLIVFTYCNAFGLAVLAERIAEQHPSKDFNRHTLIKPRIYHGREKRQISTTREEGGGGHLHHLTVAYDVDGQNYVLDLNLNRDLLPKGYFHRYQKNGSDVIERPTAEEVELCHYRGKIRDKPDSWVALSTCDDSLKGVIFDGVDMHYIEKNSIEDEHHYLYKHADIAENEKRCGYEGDAVNHDHDESDGGDRHHAFNRILRYKRDVEPMIRGPYNANKNSRYVELVLVVDNMFYKEMESKIYRVERYCKDITNIINGIYSSLNIFIALVGVVTWTEINEIKFSEDGDTTLTNFLHYRREKLIKQHPNDNAQLITRFMFNNGVVGKALKGPMCTYQYSGGVNNNHSPVIGLVATTIAHEMGHNFGMEHDTNECACPEERCVMAPSSSTVAPKHWSNCSVEYLALAFEHGMDYCLRNKPESLFGSPVCGNGFVEPGEQCDCGLPEHCANTCCNATTCLLNANASCATGECCDLTTCKPKKAGTKCRSADIECDLPEYCTGHSEYCPGDFYKLDTEPCDGGRAYCYHGYCRTRSDQCRLLWGNTGKTSDEQCYRMNTKGNRHGNCGYNVLNREFRRCEDDNVLCGMLHCKHLNERLEFGMESVATLSHSFLNLNGSIIPCRTAIVDLGVNQVDPGLAPDGAKCGDGKMCVDQRCMVVESLRARGPKCANDCNGNGVCNNMGHCHCKDGFAPPFCEYPGPGGSVDSGPASDPNARKEFVTAIFIIFLGIIPGLALVSFMVYYVRQNMKITWMQSSSTRSKQIPKPRGPVSFQPETLKRPTEDNHSLLTDEPTSPLKNEFFGHFKGFTISPKKTAPEPTRPAPPIPVPPLAAPSVAIKSPNLIRANTCASPKMNPLNKPANRISSVLNSTGNSSNPPALPPLNNGANPRPIISSPILENSTCTAKELLSPLKNAPRVPARPAPELPAVFAIKETQRPLSAVDSISSNVNNAQQDDKKPLNGSALNRIASFLKQAERKPQVGSNNSNSLPGNKKVMDKNVLRTLEISNPILQNEIKTESKTVPVAPVVMRAQSMRGPANTVRPQIPKFGSMRQGNAMKRPMSIPSGSRPKSPPPPRPAVPEIIPDKKNLVLSAIPSLPGYQKPHTDKKQNQYADCLNEASVCNKMSDAKSPSSDNIYAVIEESPVNTSVTTSPETKNSTSNSGSSESFGLLGEIVSEIQNRNLDSIYSTSTLARKKKLEEQNKAEMEKRNASETYVNTSSIYKAPESVYSNMSNVKSSASSTSSGYIAPSAVNPPINKPKLDTAEKKANSGDSPEKPKDTNRPTLTTFKAPPNLKTFSAAPNRNSLSLSANKESKSTPNDASENNKNLKSPQTTSTAPSTAVPTSKILERQVTPPKIRTRKPSPSRTNTNTNPKAPSTKTINNNNNSNTTTKSNSPDLVTSCAGKKTNGPKPPDVLNGSMKKGTSSGASSKPSHAAVPNLPKTLPKGGGAGKAVNAKTVEVKTGASDANSNKTTHPSVKFTKTSGDNVSGNKVIGSGVKLAAKQHSNVASLQQKFENKPPISAKTVTVNATAKK
ncbi:hypothetical protein Trydic_g15703 [Trypoxylus dichotomus]